MLGLVEQILHADDAVLAEFLLHDGVVGEANALLAVPVSRNMLYSERWRIAERSSSNTDSTCACLIGLRIEI